MIELKNLTIETRHPILQQVDYEFQEGTIYGIVAINGSGKTTLFRTMMNLRNAKSGNILFDGKHVEEMLGKIYYFESLEWLDQNLSGLDYLNFVKRTWKSNINIEDVLASWEMSDYIKLPIGKYSLGMKQRLIIGMYLVSDAGYMIMDEITSGLDEDNRKRFFKQLQELKAQGKTILISSHYKEEIMETCDKVLEIKQNALHEVSS